MLTSISKARVKRDRATSPLVPELDRTHEIERDMGKVCPRFFEMIKIIRSFAASRFANRTKLVIGVIGTKSGDGTTTVALGLASALADMTDDVLYVETRRAVGNTVQEDSGQALTSGLWGYLRNESPLSDVLVKTTRMGLSILPAGWDGSNISARQRIAGVSFLIGELKARFSVVVVDLPPILSSEETVALLPQLDGVVLVVAAGRTNIGDVQKALALCDKLPIEGVIMNQASQETPDWLASLLTSVH